ncbi:MAG: hypothetical protein V4857_14460 [Pseudomonadota bacterium]
MNRTALASLKMNAFAKNQVSVPGVGDIHVFVGLPDCQTFYAWVIDNLVELMHQGFEAPNPPLASITTGQMGNLGEAITLLVGRTDRFSVEPFIYVLGSALTPFNPSALTGVDIMILYLDPNGVVANDRLFIQEIKTTGKSNLDYSKALIGDYDKLLDTTYPTLSLMSRVSALKCKLKWEHRFSDDKLQRVEDLAQATAPDCTRLRLLPTLIHDRANCSVSALSHVMTEIQKQGWPQGTIEAWSISMSQLSEALVHMANRRRVFP